MSMEIAIVDGAVLTEQERVELDTLISTRIEIFKSNRQEINRLVFQSVEAMTMGEDYERQLSQKKGIKRFIGSITGSNKVLQDKINENRAAVQYASQLTLQRMAEQNLMSFDLITAVNNKLNASIETVEDEINKVYQVLLNFFKQTRSEIVRLENRVERLEQNVALLNWKNSIEYQVFNKTDYTELDDAAKIVCLTRDFYDITKGKWTTSDLLILKSAMDTIGISPKGNMSFFEIIKSIANRPELKNYLFDGIEIVELPDPTYLIPFSGLKKLEMLTQDEKYIVDAVLSTFSDFTETKRQDVIETLTKNYLRQEAQIDIMTNVDNYDIILEMLFNLKQACTEKTLLYEDDISVPSVEIGESERDIEKKRILKQFFDNDEYIERIIESCVFTQAELDELLAQERENSITIYLIGNGSPYYISDSFKDVKYIGINSPQATLVAEDEWFETIENNISIDKSVEILNVNVIKDGATTPIETIINPMYKKEVYDLNTPYDLIFMERNEKDFTVSLLFTCAKEEGTNNNQRAYIRSVKKYLEVFIPQTNVDVSRIKKITDTNKQKAIMQSLLEFFFLRSDSFENLERYDEILSFFNVNKQSIDEIKENIERIYKVTGSEGLCEKYGYAPEACISDCEYEEIHKDSQAYYSTEFIYEYNGWIFYTSGKRMFKIRENGKEKTFLFELKSGKIEKFQVHNEYIYYSYIYYDLNGFFSLFRYNPENNEHLTVYTTRIYDEYLCWFSAYKDTLFVGTRNGLLYSAALDGTQKYIFTEIYNANSGETGFIVVCNDNIYYYRDNAVYKKSISNGYEVFLCDAGAPKHFINKKCTYGISHFCLYFIDFQYYDSVGASSLMRLRFHDESIEEIWKIQANDKRIQSFDLFRTDRGYIELNNEIIYWTNNQSIYPIYKLKIGSDDEPKVIIKESTSDDNLSWFGTSFKIIRNSIYIKWAQMQWSEKSADSTMRFGTETGIDKVVKYSLEGDIEIPSL